MRITADHIIQQCYLMVFFRKKPWLPRLTLTAKEIIMASIVEFHSEAKIMKTQKTITAISFIAALFFVGLPFGSASAEEILTAQDHLQMAKHHEVLLNQAEIKLTEHKAALEDYENRSMYYGRGGQDFQSHEIANIHMYENLVAENKAQATLHYKLAGESQTSKFISGSISNTNTQVN